MSEENVLKIIKTNVTNLMRNYHFSRKVVVDSSFIPLCRILNGKTKGYHMPEFDEQIEQPIKYVHDDTKVIAFSGGKVSMACALRYKSIGQKIVLFHVANDVPEKNIKHIAEMLDSPLYIHHCESTKTPFSGMRILALATMYAVRHSFSPKIVFGYFDEASIEYNDKSDWPYCKEFIGAFESFGKRCIEDYAVINPISTYTVMWDEILGNKRYMPYITYRDTIEQKVFQNIRMDYYLDMPDKDLYLYNIEYLKSIKGNEKASLSDLWNKYFFYNIEKSRFYKELTELSSES